ncbi:MAG: type II secretion system F family protein [Blastocatellia bacterium]|nr:type II secretion system F family protein [Blastocatellia bacterium]
MSSTVAVAQPPKEELTIEQINQRRSMTLDVPEKILILDAIGGRIKSGGDVVAYFTEMKSLLDLIEGAEVDPRSFEISGKPTGGAFLKTMYHLVCIHGKPFNEACRQFPGIFEPVELVILDAGQKAGKYEEVIPFLVKHLKETRDTRDRIRKDLAYPKILVGATAIVMGISVYVIVPAFRDFFAALLGSDELPIQTALLFNLSTFCVSYWYAILGLCAGVYYGFRYLRANSPAYRQKEDSFLLKVKKIGRWILLMDLVSFLRIFIVMFKAGTGLDEAIWQAAEAVRNSEIRAAFQKAADMFSRKNPEYFYKCAAAAHPYFKFPSSFYSQFKAFEEAHASVEQLERYLEMVKHDADAIRDELLEWIKPLAVGVIGGFIGFVAIALYSPLFTLIGKLAEQIARRQGQ